MMTTDADVDTRRSAGLGEGARDGLAGGDGSDKEEELGTAPVTPKYRALGWEAITIYFIVFINVLAIAIAVVPLIAKTEQIISNASFKTDSRSAFVIVTAQLINAMTKFTTSKALSGLSDYLGRKPVLMLASSMFSVGRLLSIAAKSTDWLYLAAFTTGLGDVHVPVSQAWLCDLLQKSDRGFGFSIVAGFSFGFGFGAGLPLGGIIAQKVSVDAALWVSTLLPLCNVVLVCFICIPDTYGIMEVTESAVKVEHEHKEHKRRLPSDICSYLCKENPLSAFHLIKKAKLNPWDWGSFIFADASFKIYAALVILFLQEVMDVTEAQSGIILSAVGLVVAMFTPIMLHRYTERPLFFNGVLLQIVSYTMLAISGIPGDKGLTYLVYPGLFLWSVSVVWDSAMEAVLTLQYPGDVQGQVLGVIQQLGELCVLFAYPINILFSVTIQSGTSIPFPGLVWVFAVVFLVIAGSIQLYSVPIWTDLYVILLKKPKVMARNQGQQREDEHAFPVDTENIELSGKNPMLSEKLSEKLS